MSITAFSVQSNGVTRFVNGSLAQNAFSSRITSEPR